MEPVSSFSPRVKKRVVDGGTYDLDSYLGLREDSKFYESFLFDNFFFVFDRYTETINKDNIMRWDGFH